MGKATHFYSVTGIQGGGYVFGRCDRHCVDLTRLTGNVRSISVEEVRVLEVLQE